MIRDLEKKKFMFDLNDFNEDYVEEEELEEEPPPTFSEEELEAAIQEARAQGFEDGKMQGIQQTKESLEQAVANTLERMAADMAILYAAESERETLYEQESVAMAQVLFNTLFPLLEDKLGKEQFEKHLLSTLEKTHGQNNIQITVHPDIESAIKERVMQIANPHAHADKLVIKSEPSLGPYDYKITWDDGGAIRNRSEISEQISAIISEALAQGPVNVHDSNNNGLDAPELTHKPEDNNQQEASPLKTPPQTSDEEALEHPDHPIPEAEMAIDTPNEDAVLQQTEQNLQELEAELPPDQKPEPDTEIENTGASHENEVLDEAKKAEDVTEEAGEEDRLEAIAEGETETEGKTELEEAEKQETPPDQIEDL